MTTIAAIRQALYTHLFVKSGCVTITYAPCSFKGFTAHGLQLTRCFSFSINEANKFLYNVENNKHNDVNKRNQSNNDSGKSIVSHANIIKTN